MPSKRLHHVRVSADSQRSSEATSTTNIAAQGILNSGGSSVEALSLDPGQRRLEASIRGTHAEMVASEIEELFGAPGISKVVYCAPDGGSPEDGYYVLEEGSFSRANTAEKRVQQISGTVRHAGTRNSDWRALTTSQSQVDHAEQWGNSTAAMVTLPALANKAQWHNEETGAKAPASPVSTRPTEFGDVDVYDLADGENAVGASNPTLIYEIPYADDYRGGLRVYDTRGNGSKTDADGNRQWMVVSRRQHDFADSIVLDTGVLRLKLDEPAGTISAEEWDATNEVWSAISLTNDSSWSLFDVDLTSIGMVSAEAQLTFSDGTELFALDAIVTRGADAVLFDNPQADDGEPIPQGLLDWLDPIAASTVVATGETKGLVSRQEVRR
jgi:hypothetical protein